MENTSVDLAVTKYETGDDFVKAHPDLTNAELANIYNYLQSGIGKLGGETTENVTKFRDRKAGYTSVASAFNTYKSLFQENQSVSKNPAVTAPDLNVCPTCGRKLAPERSAASSHAKTRKKVGANLLYPYELTDEEMEETKLPRIANTYRVSTTWASLQSIIDNPGMTYEQYVEFHKTHPIYSKMFEGEKLDSVDILSRLIRNGNVVLKTPDGVSVEVEKEEEATAE